MRLASAAVASGSSSSPLLFVIPRLPIYDIFHLTFEPRSFSRSRYIPPCGAIIARKFIPSRWGRRLPLLSRNIYIRYGWTNKDSKRIELSLLPYFSLSLSLSIFYFIFLFWRAPRTRRFFLISVFGNKWIDYVDREARQIFGECLLPAMTERRIIEIEVCVPYDVRRKRRVQNFYSFSSISIRARIISPRLYSDDRID